ncbi:MAG: hypothetical protein F4X34_04455 [Chloroflexi bacterium]|nr:hypothetical protein [Chloroflexota bacterium]
MSELEPMHQHLDDDQIDELARATLEGLTESVEEVGCVECDERIRLHGRCISLARLLTRDTLAPPGRPAVGAVRAIRRRSYRGRVIGEIAAMLTTSPVRARV